jgi:hypothetical protein
VRVASAVGARPAARRPSTMVPARNAQPRPTATATSHARSGLRFMITALVMAQASVANGKRRRRRASRPGGGGASTLGGAAAAPSGGVGVKA